MVRFPTYEHLVESGLATNKEMIQLKQMDDLVNKQHQISWFPFMWAQNLLRKARKEGLIANDWFTHVLIKEVDNMANMNGMLICYGWINIPLVYTQVEYLSKLEYLTFQESEEWHFETAYALYFDFVLFISFKTVAFNHILGRNPGSLHLLHILSLWPAIPPSHPVQSC